MAVIFELKYSATSYLLRFWWVKYCFNGSCNLYHWRQFVLQFKHETRYIIIFTNETRYIINSVDAKLISRQVLRGSLTNVNKTQHTEVHFPCKVLGNNYRKYWQWKGCINFSKRFILMVSQIEYCIRRRKEFSSIEMIHNSSWHHVCVRPIVEH